MCFYLLGHSDLLPAIFASSFVFLTLMKNDTTTLVATSDCAKCGHENPVSYSFCASCGGRLTLFIRKQLAVSAILIGGAALVVAIGYVNLNGFPSLNRQSNTPEAASEPTSQEQSEENITRQKALWQKGAAAKQQGRPNAARFFWNQALTLNPANNGINEAIEKLPDTLPLKNLSEADLQGLTKLKVVKAVFFLEKMPRIVHAGPYCDASSWDFSSDVRNQIMAARWTVYVRNDLTADISTIAFRTHYSGKGHSVSREMGLKRFQDCDAPAKFGIANVDNLKIGMPAGQTTKVTLVDLVSFQAAELLKRGGGSIDIYVRNIDSGQTDSGDGAAEQHTDVDSHSGNLNTNKAGGTALSPIDRYTAALNALPNINVLVSNVVQSDSTTVVVYVTSEYNSADYHDRLAFAQVLQNQWILSLPKSQANSASTILKASDGQTVGGTDMWRHVWVEK